MLRVLPRGEPRRRPGRQHGQAPHPPEPGQPGGIVEKEAAIHISNVAHIDPEIAASRPASAIKFLEDGRKVRFAKRSGEVLDA